MNLSTYLRTQLAEYVRGVDLPAAPTSLELALSTTDPLADGSGLTEPPGADGYARQTLTFGAPTSTIGQGSKINNDAPVVFGPVVNNDWPTVTHAAIFDNSGNMLLHGELNVQRTAPVGDQVSLATNVIQFNMGKVFGEYFALLVLEWMRGNAAPAAPVSTELALSLADPLEDASGLDEPVLGYSRQTVTFTQTSTPSGITIISEGPYVFGPADVNWGFITHGAVFTPGGDLLFSGPTAVSRNVLATDSFPVPFGALTLLFT